MSPRRQPEPSPWLVTRWPPGSCHYEVLSVHRTRDEAMAAAAAHPGAQLVFRRVPPPAPNPPAEI